MSEGIASGMAQAAAVRYELLVAAYMRCPPDWRDDRFIPEFHRFYYIVDGEGMVELEGTRYYPKPGQLLLLPGGIPQGYSTISDQPFEKFWVHFVTSDGWDIFKLLKLPVVVDVEEEERGELVEKLHRLVALYEGGQSYAAAFERQSLLLELIAFFLARTEPKAGARRPAAAPGKMDTLLAYIEKHLSSPLSVGQLAEQAHYHPKHLIRAFKQWTGSTPIQYIQSRRIDVARQLLLTTDRTVSDIADVVGLDPKQLSKLFKERFGYSPSVYKSMMKTTIPYG